MKLRLTLQAGLLVPFLGAGLASAQIPGAAGVPAGAAGAATAAAGAAGKGGGLCKFIDCIHKCKERMCQKPCGQFINNMMRPMSLMTGGMLGNFCPDKLSDEEIAKKKDSEKAAAEVQKIEAEAGARRAAIRYLATADCHWYPDVGKEIGKALRTDTVECVRLEAASALLTGCCCTKDTIDALKNAITCEPEDGHPSETSGRVQWVAFQALNKCLACYVEKPKKEEEKKSPAPKDAKSKDEKPDMASSGQMIPRDNGSTTQSKRLSEKSLSEVVAEARLAVKEYQARHQMEMAAGQTGGGERSLAAVFSRSSATPTLKPIPMEPSTAVAKSPAPGQSDRVINREVVSETIVPVNPAHRHMVSSKPLVSSTDAVNGAVVEKAKPTVPTEPVVAPAAAIKPYEPKKRNLYDMVFKGRSSGSEEYVVETKPIAVPAAKMDPPVKNAVASTPAPAQVPTPSAPSKMIQGVPATRSIQPVPAVGMLAPSSTPMVAPSQTKPAFAAEPAAIGSGYARPAQLTKPGAIPAPAAKTVKPAYQPVELIESASYSEPAGQPLPQAGANYPRRL